MYKYILPILLSLSIAMGAQAEGFCDDMHVDLRLGLSIGGAMPLGMPETIRGLDNYTLMLNPLVEIDVEKPLDSNWGILTGVRYDRKAMDITARVKNYRMTIVRGGETLSGVFTGHNQTSESQWSVSVPVNATYTIKRVRLMAGPYLSYVVGRKFEGSAFDGYLRVDDPTGPKVLLGTAADERGTYDFADEMRRWQCGAQIGADWHLGTNWGVFGMLQWGLSGIHKGTFHTIQQTLYPIFGTVGVAIGL